VRPGVTATFVQSLVVSIARATQSVTVATTLLSCQHAHSRTQSNHPQSHLHSPLAQSQSQYLCSGMTAATHPHLCIPAGLLSWRTAFERPPSPLWPAAPQADLEEALSSVAHLGQLCAQAPAAHGALNHEVLCPITIYLAAGCLLPRLPSYAAPRLPATLHGVLSPGHLAGGRLGTLRHDCDVPWSMIVMSHGASCDAPLASAAAALHSGLAAQVHRIAAQLCCKTLPARPHTRVLALYCTQRNSIVEASDIADT
jgi:hypothetical protein